VNLKGYYGIKGGTNLGKPPGELRQNPIGSRMPEKETQLAQLVGVRNTSMRGASEKVFDSKTKYRLLGKTILKPRKKKGG